MIFLYHFQLCSGLPLCPPFTLCPHFQKIKQTQLECYIFLLPVNPPRNTCPRWSPFQLLVPKYWKTHFTGNSWWPHKAESLKKFLSGNIEPPFSPKNKRWKRKPKNKMPTQQRQYQITATTIRILTYQYAYQHNKETITIRTTFLEPATLLEKDRACELQHSLSTRKKLKTPS